MKDSVDKPKIQPNDGGADAIREERAFIHDLSSPLAIASGLLEILAEELINFNSLEEQQKVRLQKAIGSLEKMKELLRARRSHLIEKQEAEASAKKAG